MNGRWGAIRHAAPADSSKSLKTLRFGESGGVFTEKDARRQRKFPRILGVDRASFQTALNLDAQGSF
jgi:hypothetical protein